MPQTAPNEAKVSTRTAPERKPGPPAPKSSSSEHAPPQSGDKSALFRALVDAGADAVLAYTGTEETKSMVSESVAEQIQPVLMEMRQLFREQNERLDKLTEIVAQHERRLDSLAADVQGLKETIEVKLGALKTEIRLMWGALGVLVTVLIAAFGFLVTN